MTEKDMRDVFVALGAALPKDEIIQQLSLEIADYFQTGRHDSNRVEVLATILLTHTAITDRKENTGCSSLQAAQSMQDALTQMDAAKHLFDLNARKS